MGAKELTTGIVAHPPRSFLPAPWRFLLAAALLVPPLSAQADLVAQGYDHFYNLEYPEAIADFQRAIALHPKDPELHNHLAQAIVFQEMYRNGALESELVSGNNSFLRRPKLNPAPATEERFLGEVSTAIALCDARLKTNPNDTAALYAEGISYGLRSDYYWVVKKSWRDSLRDATAARRLHNRVSALDPQNVDARLVQGLHDYIVGSLPWGYRMLGFLVGIHGDKAEGIRTVQDVATHGRDNRLDATIFLCALYRRENHTRLAVPLVEELIQNFPRNYILRLELSQMYSMAGDKAHALEAVEKVAELKNSHSPGYDRVPWEKIYFQEGIVEFWYNDLDRALENMKKVAAASASDEMDLNTGVSAWMRIGQIYDMEHHRAEALAAYKKAIAYAPQAEAAQESRKYLSEPYRRM
ncbi:MAG TPA: tetratricopeptide repeat protein [Bryobacteraceae bacterium]|nr:tetratricopeptide repeat protein [Bryobacteraceae bacterium]